MVVFPALAVMLAVLSFNFIGDALRDFLDPRARGTIGL
jgi:peptide/nickel transport system permease protein